MNLPTEVYIIVPSLSPTGPVKGAVALSNGLAGKLPVHLVDLKPAEGCGIPLDQRVERLPLHRYGSWRSKYHRFRANLKASAKTGRVASISFCFSADVMNALAGKCALTIGNVRGNLLKNYQYDYGWPGLVLARLHYLIARRLDHVVAMSAPMARQLNRVGLRRVTRIGNFLDEAYLETFRKNKPPQSAAFRMVFVGSLSRRKRPNLAINLVKRLVDSGCECRLDIVGSGPMRSELEDLVSSLNLLDRIIFHGQVITPFDLIQAADLMILPSESEGIPRAALESLFFGVPCLLRSVDGNQELITEGVNGYLFQRDGELPGAALRAVASTRERSDLPRQNLLPPQFHQTPNIEKYLDLIQSSP